LVTRGVIRSYEDLEAFQRAMALLKPIHRLALKFPEYERFDLTSQTRRASKSVPTNIAEGYGKRRSARHFKSYLESSIGSANEMVVHLQVAHCLEYVTQEETDPLIAEYRVVGKMLVRLMEKWQTYGSGMSRAGRSEGL
jgi:four helix bundle protein